MIFGIPASFQQHAYSPISKDSVAGVEVDWARVGIVLFILVGLIIVSGFDKQIQIKLLSFMTACQNDATAARVSAIVWQADVRISGSCSDQSLLTPCPATAQ